jgi:hypothetical protein
MRLGRNSINIHYNFSKATKRSAYIEKLSGKVCLASCPHYGQFASRSMLSFEKSRASKPLNKERSTLHDKQIGSLPKQIADKLHLQAPPAVKFKKKASQNLPGKEKNLFSLQTYSFDR